jgi:diphosphomevalonate decarboxylase
LDAATATVRAGSNIAFIKYWGVADPALNLPLNGSISMTLADAHTTTTVAWDRPGMLAEDLIVVDDVVQTGASAARIGRHLDRMRAMAGVNHRAHVVSRNNFPMASGIASSASGFAALTVAGCRALGLELGDAQLSALARLGSGSACRSIFGGYVRWDRGHDDASSTAHPIFAADHWDLRDVVAVVSHAAKAVSSEAGHRLAATSPLNAARVAFAEVALEEVEDAIRRRDLAALGPLLEQDALAMHAVMMTGSPSLLYWLPGTLEIIDAARRWRERDGLPVYFTIDAGPNVHLICPAAVVDEVQARATALSTVQHVIASRPGPGPALLDRHLF